MKMRLLYRAGLLFTLLTQFQGRIRITLTSRGYSQKFDHPAPGCPTGFTVGNSYLPVTEQTLNITANSPGKILHWKAADC